LNPHVCRPSLETGSGAVASPIIDQSSRQPPDATVMVRPRIAVPLASKQGALVPKGQHQTCGQSGFVNTDLISRKGMLIGVVL
jgi:hypothetical protein